MHVGRHFSVMWNLTQTRPLLYYSPPSSSGLMVSLLLALHHWRMSSCRLDDNPFSFDFLAEFLATFDFSNFVPADGSLLSFGSHKHKIGNASFSFSVESYVGVGNHCHHHLRCRRCSCRHHRRCRLYLILAVAVTTVVVLPPSPPTDAIDTDIGVSLPLPSLLS
jgi:hypothetical protein